MSQENVEAFLKAADAYTRGDLEAYLETAHPDVEWYPFSAEAEGGEAYRGRGCSPVVVQPGEQSGSVRGQR